MCSLVRFPPFSVSCINLLKHSKINDSKYMNLDAAYFMMLMKDLPTLFGIMLYLANQNVLVKDLLEFDD